MLANGSSKVGGLRRLLGVGSKRGEILGGGRVRGGERSTSTIRRTMVELQRWMKKTGSGKSDGDDDGIYSTDPLLPSSMPLSPASIAKLGRQLSGNAITLLVIIAWYISNIGVLLLNKYLLSNYGYKYPIFLTMLHMYACSVYSYVFISWFQFIPMQYISSRKQLMKIICLSFIFSLSVVCGNVSLRYLPVSFNQAIGATTPFFTAIFAVLIVFKCESTVTYLTLIPVVLGIVIASNFEPLFDLFGFLMCISSTSARALKSVVQGMLLTSESEKLNAMNLLLYMAPIAVIILLPATLIMEGNVALLTVGKARESFMIVFLLLANMTMAYSVNLFNFLVTKHTSPLTLQVLGNAKAAIAVFVSVLIFRNPVTVMGMIGFGITLFGVVLYSEAKKRSKPPPQ